ncbi:MAG: hypothetical protein H7287_03140 [Thermoleophilia bacterium]|nr:hypothetical protein [Thermoleophilia bacterium]
MDTPHDAYADDRTYSVAVVSGVAQLHVATLPAGSRLKAIAARTPRAATTS